MQHRIESGCVHCRLRAALDGGVSGGHLERPALQRLRQAVDERRVDHIVVYKIDQLTRSLPDFATLVQNNMMAQRWLAMIIDGKTITEIAQAEGNSPRRIQNVINLAMLAPDFLESISAGEQPNGLTTDYLIKTDFQANWSQQRAQFVVL